MLAEVWKKRRKWLICIVAVLCLAMLALFATGFSLEISLDGSQTVKLEYGVQYQEPGAQILLRGNIFFRNGIAPKTDLIIENGIQSGELGEFVVRYRASFLGTEALARRTVIVVDSKQPEIQLTGEKEVFVKPGEQYEEEGFTATDNYDGDLTEAVVREILPGKIIYTVTDSSGNSCTEERIIKETEPSVPYIWLREGEEITIPAGQIYEDPGFVAWDGVDGELTDMVQVDGEVLWYVPGEYELRYSVMNSEEQSAQVIRRIAVLGEAWQQEVIPEGKIIYLTFDDGPGVYTPILLDILDKYDVKATFFVVDSGNDWILKEITQRGHSIGIHTMTHDFRTVYESPEAYFKDLQGMQSRIYEATGVRTTLMRFPGGSSNTVSYFNPGIMSLLTKAVQDAGFRYFDWNVDSNDAGGAISKNVILANIQAGVLGQRVSIVLQHDIHLNSIYAVEDFIVWGIENGYTFLPLQQDSPCCHHDVRN